MVLTFSVRKYFPPTRSDLADDSEEEEDTATDSEDEDDYTASQQPV